jgi:hypothetical protein
MVEGQPYFCSTPLIEVCFLPVSLPIRNDLPGFQEHKKKNEKGKFTFHDV